MRKNSPVHPADVRAIARLATDAVLGLTDMVESMHGTIARVPLIGAAAHARTKGVAGLAYRSVRGITRTAGMAADAVLGQIVPLLGERPTSPRREAVLAAANGVLGDYLKATGNPLAIPMQLQPGGRLPRCKQPALPALLPDAGRRLLVLVHGLCMNDLQWVRAGHSHGAALARELGYTALYLHYNSGRHISVNGREFAERLQAVVAAWPQPVEELVIIGHSMGGLVARSACHYGIEAGHDWPARLAGIVFLGTPHHGAPLERIGNWIENALKALPYAAPLAGLGMLRSAGITDLRHGNLTDEDWDGVDRFARAPDLRSPLALPPRARSYAIAGRLGGIGGKAGDGLVTVDSALGRHDEPARRLAFPTSHTWVAEGVGHLDLLCNAQVYARLRDWLAAGRR
ncbi:MAG TPA: alpha/beta hydrolase [Noviherbaspirillum sp.]|uniref:esterase/lipase family protein n=1 Tax=Noviherbaspirillum sp. TaxID=1926288 RepID=UPI002D2AD044|nr:alpha/beta hydrolase [Noviherbaspirillum sp.]HYD96987.1 alpha/beta hydrolase [Noviherbaspirillum sp.]